MCCTIHIAYREMRYACIGYHAVLKHSIRSSAWTRTQHALPTRRADQMCPVATQQQLSLLAHGLGHGEYELVAPRRGDVGQRNACVAGCRLDEGGLSWRDESVALGLVDHRVRYSVLYTAWPSTCMVHVSWHCISGKSVKFMCSIAEYTVSRRRRLASAELGLE
jgi:hypothetical protein